MWMLLAAVAGATQVSDASGLLAAIAAAAPGDVIELASGTYDLTGATCAAAGTPTEPIVVRSAVPLGALIRFDGVEGFHVTGPNWHFEGLDVVGVCAVDSDCEHAFHVTGAATGFVLRDSRVVDFNAQLKVNASDSGTGWLIPHDGLVERNEIFDTRGRQTSNPTTKLNLDTGDRWVVRDNYLHDFHKDGGDTVSYGAFMKSGGSDGVFERNLVVCTTTDDPAGARIGLSFGGGGTAPQFCAPAFDAAVPCSVEHTGGTIRNNVVANCSDVAVYLNRAAETSVLANTFVATSGVDFRFDTTSGLAQGNLLSGPIRNRDGATHTALANRTDVALADFQAWYTDPVRGDLSIAGDVSGLVGSLVELPGVVDDYCARPRGAGPFTVGALEHALGDCATIPPPGAADPGTTTPTDTGDPADPPDPADPVDTAAPKGASPGETGCGCASGGGSGPAWVALALALVRRRRRR